MNNHDVSEYVTELLDRDADEQEAVAALEALALSGDQIIEHLYGSQLLWYFASRCDWGDIGPQELMRRWPTCVSLIAELYPQETA